MNSTVKTPSVSVDDVLAQFGSREHRSTFTQNSQHGVAFATGFHVYADIGVTLPLSGAEDTSATQRFLELLGEFAIIGEGAAEVSKARLLEVQGERLHFLLEDPNHALVP